MGELEQQERRRREGRSGGAAECSDQRWRLLQTPPGDRFHFAVCFIAGSGAIAGAASRWTQIGRFIFAAAAPAAK